MKIKIIPKEKVTAVKHVYDETDPTIIVGGYLTPPTTTASYNGRLIKSKTPVSGPSPPVASSTGQTGRYNYILNYVKNVRKVKYVYYYGHHYTWQNVIRNQKGNCCDLTRLVDVLAKQTGMASSAGSPITERRFVRATIYYRGSEYYTHVWNELKVNGQWKTLDMTNYIIHGSPALYGKIRELQWRKNANNITPC